MALRPTVPGLRQFHNKSNDVAKIQINVPAGDPISVTDYVAAQLGPAFVEGAPPEPVAPEPEAEPTEAAPVKKAAAKRTAAAKK